MAQSDKKEQAPELQICEEHQEQAKWVCGVCEKPVCKTCKPIALNYQVYHRRCVDKARQSMEVVEQGRKEVDAPSLSVKVIAWIFMVSGIVLFGLALFIIGLALFSKNMPIRAFMAGTVPASLDSIPGSRSILKWVGGLSLFFSVMITVLGAALYNCVAAARYAILTIAWFEIALAVVGWLIVLVVGGGFWDIPVIGGFMAWFFMRKNIRRQFEKVL